MATRMQQRRGTAAQWTTANPVLAAGEIGFETDTNKFKMGNGTSAWTALTYFANAAELAAIIDGAPAALDTLNELAAALGDDPNFLAALATTTYVTNAIAAAAVDNSLLAGTGLDWNSETEQFQVDNTIATTQLLIDHNTDTTGVHGIADTSVLATTTDVNDAIADAAADATSKVSTHNSDTTNVHGIADTSALALTADVDSALALKQDKVTGVDDTEIGYLNGVTSAIQTQLDAKFATANASTTNISEGTNLYFTDERAQDAVGNSVGTGLSYNDTTGAVSVDTTTIQARVADVSDTEIGYLNGVTSAIQTQIDAKAPLASPTFTGTVNAAAVTISGDLTVSGTTTTVSATDLVVSDPLIYIGEGNTANLVDLGLVSSFDNGTYQHSGIVRDASAGKWKIFKGVTDEPTTTINFAQGSLDDLAVGAFEASSATIGDVSNTELQYLNGVTSAVQTQLDAKLSSATAASTYAPLASPTFTGTVTLPAAGIVFSDGTQAKEGVPSRTPIIQKTGAYTLSALTERDSLIEVSSASGVTITIPTNATVAYPVGTSIDILQTNTGQVTIAGAGGVTVNATPGLKLRTQWSSATLFKRATDTWVVYGDLSA